MTWYTVSLSSADISSQKHIAIQDAFEILFMACQAPADAAMFALNEPGNPNYVVYFSPSAATLASLLISSYGGVSCTRPTSSVSLLVGHANARERLLP
ncbi:hypothetical protein VN23_08020 [Janthinobacterium sp. B9-8]|nr:hypothetical protein VN23_08020 [Janthinobacterium sp. B9-8]